MREVKCK